MCLALYNRNQNVLSRSLNKAVPLSFLHWKSPSHLCPDSKTVRVIPLGQLSVYQDSFSISEEEMYNLTTHSAHFIYGYMTSDIW